MDLAAELVKSGAHVLCIKVRIVFKSIGNFLCNNLLNVIFSGSVYHKLHLK